MDIFYNDLTLKCDKWLPYFKVYEHHLSNFIGKDPIIVEVGVQGGGSLQMWRKYFGPGAVIHGIDNDTSVLEHQKHYDDRIKLHIGNQEDTQFWLRFLNDVPIIDIFIDDGGHHMHQQINTLVSVLPYIKQGGVYICEDTHTSYYNGYYGEYFGGLRKESTFITLAKDLIDVLNYGHIEPSDKANMYHMLEAVCKDMYSITFYNSMMVIHKDKIEPFVRDVVNEK